jgi:predicted DNA-binding transcriptional regulator YafY
LSRSERLLGLMRLLRRHRHPVSRARIAAELGISLRTLYRDIAALQAQGARIDGAAGLGFLLRPGFVLPSLMFPVDEVDALVLGSRWVADRGDARLRAAARDALAKTAAVLPGELREELDASALIVAPGAPVAAGDVELATVRQAIRQQLKLAITYRDAAGRDSDRTVWPFGVGFFDRARVVMAWCELRADIRHFRTDRIVAVAPTGERYPRPRQSLLTQWREQEGVDPR